MTAYKIFGAGAGGLYTAWRLAASRKLNRGDTIELIEWGNYAFDGAVNPTRPPAGRICTHHYKGDPAQSYVELGGMRYVQWNPDTAQGHQLVTKTIEMLGLNSLVVDFETTGNPLFYLRDRRFYGDDVVNKSVKAPYNTGANDKPSDNLATHISKLMTGTRDLRTRAAQCEFYSSGTLPKDVNSFVYSKDDVVGNVGYWNFFYDQAGNEGYEYYGDAGGYTSNVIAWNAADAAIYNGEFAPGGAFKTLSRGYSALFARLYYAASTEAFNNGINFTLTQNTRLHSIWLETIGGHLIPHYRTAPASQPFSAPSAPLTANYVFLCMPPRSVELVANATRYLDMTGKVDFLNHAGVQNYLESVILQPSYKVAMFFDHPWWTSAKFPPKLANHVYGPTVTDIALRQVYYFGNNGTATPPVYGLLASYDDMEFTTFWQQMQLSGKERRKVPLSQDYQPLLGPAKAPAEMERMLRLELAKVHFTKWPPDGNQVPPPLETSFLNWGLNPFGAGYHGWSSHYDIGAVMQNIRTPTYMATGLNAGVFIVGEAFSNDQGWVEGAFCTAESVLVDFLGLIERAQQGVGPGPRTENEVGRRIGGAPTGHLIGPCGPRDRRRLLHNEIRPCAVGQLAE